MITVVVYQFSNHLTQSHSIAGNLNVFVRFNTNTAIFFPSAS
jgi:hypothetical protein